MKEKSAHFRRQTPHTDDSPLYSPINVLYSSIYKGGDLKVRIMLGERGMMKTAPEGPQSAESSQSSVDPAKGKPRCKLKGALLNTRKSRRSVVEGEERV